MSSGRDIMMRRTESVGGGEENMKGEVSANRGVPEPV
jgi:hypothetical protein